MNKIPTELPCVQDLILSLVLSIHSNHVNTVLGVETVTKSLMMLNLDYYLMMLLKTMSSIDLTDLMPPNMMP
jgi:hypothetical protein